LSALLLCIAEDGVSNYSELLEGTRVGELLDDELMGEALEYPLHPLAHEVVCHPLCFLALLPVLRGPAEVRRRLEAHRLHIGRIEGAGGESVRMGRNRGGASERKAHATEDDRGGAGFAEPANVETVSFEATPNLGRTSQDLAIRVATTEFIRGMRDADARTLWTFASEEDQEAFATKDAVLQAYVESFPILTQTQSATFERIAAEGDTKMVTLALRDKAGNAYNATIGLFLDDANDWKVVSCDIAPADGRTA